MVEVKFEQVEGAAVDSPLAGASTPPAVVVTVNSAEDLTALGRPFVESEWEDAQTFKNLANSHEGEIITGKWVFEIPGDEAGEVGDLWLDVTTPDLWWFLQEMNEKAVAKAAGEED